MKAAAGSPAGGSREHYSYTHYDDRAVAEGFDALRFGGPIGQYLQETQQTFLLSAVGSVAGQAVLDVGTGTGRAAVGLARAGAAVTGVDAAKPMLAVAQRRAREAGVTVRFEVADAHALPFKAGSFDAVVCLRVIMHTPDWRRCLAECCRVSRSRVIVDFPARASFAAIESGARRLAQAAGRRVEAYRVMAERDVAAALAASGFRVVLVHRQFVLPIAVHKAIGSLRFTKATERALAAVGLLRLCGSPVTMVAQR